MSSIKYLARQGIALRGHDEENSNFIQLLNLHAEDDDNLKEWLLRKSKKYTSLIIQNEILKDMALTILRDIVNSIKDSGCYSIMTDESSNISSVQQFVNCIRWVDNVFEPHEDFIGLHAVEIANTKNLSQILKDILRLGLNRELLRRQCYDGCRTMMGKVSGVAQIIEQGISHRGLVVHCFCHSLSLACRDTIKNGTLMKNSLNTSFEITNLVKFSPKRAPHLKEIIAEDMSTEFYRVFLHFTKS